LCFRIRAIIVYPVEIGRNFNEVLRVIDALQLNQRKEVLCPVNWQHGDECVILENHQDQKRKANSRLVPMPSKKSYMRFVEAKFVSSRYRDSDYRKSPSHGSLSTTSDKKADMKSSQGAITPVQPARLAVGHEERSPSEKLASF